MKAQKNIILELSPLIISSFYLFLVFFYLNNSTLSLGIYIFFLLLTLTFNTFWPIFFLNLIKQNQNAYLPVFFLWLLSLISICILLYNKLIFINFVLYSATLALTATVLIILKAVFHLSNLPFLSSLDTAFFMLSFHSDWAFIGLLITILTTGLYMDNLKKSNKLSLLKQIAEVILGIGLWIASAIISKKIILLILLKS
jgi:hypothetical protein